MLSIKSNLPNINIFGSGKCKITLNPGIPINISQECFSEICKDSLVSKYLGSGYLEVSEVVEQKEESRDDGISAPSQEQVVPEDNVETPSKEAVTKPKRTQSKS